ncbi:hypothetical protein [Marinobacter lutaoensis]|uniref:hypothetical protein n=1 Tax=Marinobacter lutaoensis TaxID=135739 RepID=UPI001115A673|nr:hypothetical protein [Marinobacter lutaoensis]
MPTRDTSVLTQYLDKQREIRQLAKNAAAELTGSLKNDVQSVLTKYGLGPEQLIEAICLIFDVDNPLSSPSNSLVAAQNHVDGNQGEPSKDHDLLSQLQSYQDSERSDSDMSGQIDRQSSHAGGGTGMSRPRKVSIRPRTPTSSPADGESVGDTKNAGPGADAFSSQGKLATDPRKSSIVFRNPYTEEVLRVVSEDDATLQKWIEEYGEDAVESWRLVSPLVSRVLHPTLEFVNPHTGAILKTRSRNHRQYREWVKKYGEDEVETWLQHEGS